MTKESTSPTSLLSDTVEIPIIPAQITDHDELSGFSSSKSWPAEKPQHCLMVHLHLCELIHAWNLSPYKVRIGTAAVDEWAETQGITRFSFTNKFDRNDFIERYDLDDFVVETFDPDPDSNEPFTQISTYFLLTLTNQFAREDVSEFFGVYRSVMNELAIVETERRRAIHTDGNKVGYISVDHFNARERFETTRIAQARAKLGLSNGG